MRNLRLLFVAAVAGVFLAVGCHDNHPTTAQHVHATATVALSQTAVTLKAGEHAALSAQPKCSCGEVMPSTVTWASSNTAVATVDATGDVVAVSFGSATITASADGKSGAATVTVEPTGTVVTSLGGSVASSDGAVVLDVPAGALTTPTDITITPVEDATFGGDSLYLAGTGYEIKPTGLTLQQPADLRLRYNPAQLPAGVLQEQLRIRERDRQQNQWRDCDQLGLQDQHVVARIGQFGVFGLVVQLPVGKLIGPAGGTVTSADGVASLVIPEGALDAVTDIVVSKVADSEFGGDANYVSGTGYKVEPSDVTLHKPAAMTITYEPGNVPSGMDVTQLRIQQRDRTQNKWQDCDHSGIEGHAVGADITSFATFAVTGKSGGNNGGGGSAGVWSVSISPSFVNLSAGDAIQLTATVLDSAGNTLDVPVTWSVTNPAVASVSSTGVLTAVTNGSTSVTASAGGKQGGSTVNVSTKITTITVTGDNTITVGATSQLTAKATSSTGEVVAATFTWTSSDPAVATVDANGLVTGVAGGTSDITAASKNVSGFLTVTVSTTGGGGGGGGDTETSGNNLSWPVVFVNGTGVTGLAVSADPGVRPIAAETAAAAELAAIPFASPSAAFWYTGNATDASGYYLQGTANTWRPQIIDGTGQPSYDAQAYWGDNLSGSASLKAGHPIRIEVALSATGVGTLQGYNMPYVVNASSPDEIQGTDGTLGDYVPLIFAPGATLIVEQLSGPGGTVVSTVSNGAIGSEVNVAGRLVYGGQFKPTVAGTYRLRFIIPGTSNCAITSVGNTTGTATVVSAVETAIEIQVTP
jgi:uncharacterized protein YjdB